MKSLRTASRQKQKQQLDRLFAAKVKLRDHYRCRICNSGHNPQCAHLFSRRYLNTRWAMDGAWTLCQKHHFYYTKHPDEWFAYLEWKLGREAYEQLRARAFTVTKPDYAAIRLYLEAA